MDKKILCLKCNNIINLTNKAIIFDHCKEKICILCIKYFIKNQLIFDCSHNNNNKIIVDRFVYLYILTNDYRKNKFITCDSK